MDRRMFMKNGLLAVLGTGLAAQSVLFHHKMAHAASAEGDKKMKILVLTGSPRKNGLVFLMMILSLCVNISLVQILWFLQLPCIILACHLS